MAARHVVLPGGSGFLGRSLARRLTARGDRVTVLTRGQPGSGDGWQSVHWDGRSSGGCVRVLEGADAVVQPRLPRLGGPTPQQLPISALVRKVTEQSL